MLFGVFRQSRLKLEVFLLTQAWRSRNRTNLVGSYGITQASLNWLEFLIAVRKRLVLKLKSQGNVTLISISPQKKGGS